MLYYWCNQFLQNLNGKVITDVIEAYNQYVQYGQAYGGIPPYQVSEYQNNFNVEFSATDITDSMWNSMFGGQPQLKYTISPVAFTQEYSKYLNTKKEQRNVDGSSMNVDDILDIGKSAFQELEQEGAITPKSRQVAKNLDTTGFWR